MNPRSPSSHRAAAPALVSLLAAIVSLHAACSGGDDSASDPGASGAGNQAAGPGGLGGQSPAGTGGQGGHAAGSAGSAAGSAGGAGKSGAGAGGKGGAGISGNGGAGQAGASGASAGGAGTGGAGQNQGGAGQAGQGGAAAGGPPAGQVKGLVAVGYGGLRVVSRDLGATWGDHAFSEAGGGDDLELLRAVVWGNGLWVSTGWKLFTSPDGVTWQDHGKLRENGGPDIMPCNIVEGLAFREGYFYAICDGIMRSTDGLKWDKFGPLPDLGGHAYMTYRAGQFVAYGDNKTSYSSPDALTWTPMDGLSQATYCDGAFRNHDDCKDSAWFDSIWLRADWGGKIMRSTDGNTFTVAYQDEQQNTPYQSRAIAEGYVKP
jgi:hypothetical protein